MRFLLAFSLLLFVFHQSVLAQQTFPLKFPYHGFIKDNYQNVVNIKKDIKFRIFDSAENGNLLWEELQPQVEINNGWFKVVLGSENPVPSDLFLNPNLFLEIVIDDKPLVPRQKILPLPYAYLAKYALGAKDCETLQGVAPDDFALKGHTHKGEEIIGAVQEAINCNTLEGYTLDEILNMQNGEVNLKPDSIKDVSNGVITNSFILEIPAADTPVGIPDAYLYGYESKINFPYTGIIKNVRVYLEVDHSNYGDLKIELLSPFGESVILHNNEAEKPVNGWYPDNVKPSIGDFSSFQGKDPFGDWILKIVDSKIENSGTLKVWKLKVDYISGEEVKVNGSLKIGETDVLHEINKLKCDLKALKMGSCDSADADLCKLGEYRCDENLMIKCVETVHREEVCNGIDDDCDLQIDEECSDYDGDKVTDAVDCEPFNSLVPQCNTTECILNSCKNGIGICHDQSNYANCLNHECRYVYFYRLLEKPETVSQIRGISITNDEIVAAGYIKKNSSYGDGWVVKTDKFGSVKWEKTFGGNKDDGFYAVADDDENNFIAGGYKVSSNADGWIVKFDKDGSVIWEKIIGKLYVDYFQSVVADKNFYFAAGYYQGSGSWNSNYEARLVKLDKNGNIVWDKNFGGTKDDYFRSLVIDGDYLIAAGYTSSKGSGSFDGWLVKLDKDGNVIWEKTVGGSMSDMFVSLKVDGENNYIVGGYTYKAAGNSDAWIIKFDKNGNVIWNVSFGGVKIDSVSSIVAFDNYYLAAGQTQSKGSGNGDIWVLKIDENGTLLWDKTFGESGNDTASSIAKLDNGFLIGGTITYPSKNRGALIKLDDEGQLAPASEFCKIYSQ